MSDLSCRTTDLERRADALDDDIRHIYRGLRWLRRGPASIRVHLGIATPKDEDE